MRAIVSAVYVTLIIVASLIGGGMTNAFFGMSLFILLVGAFFLQGFRNIPAEPPHRGAVTFLGSRTGKQLGEGWVFLPFNPWLFGAVLVEVTKRNLDLEAIDIRTADMAELSVPVSITYTPVDLVRFLNAGGESGVNNILADAMREALREWAISTDTDFGPDTWEEALQARGEAIPVLINAATGRHLREHISDDILAGTRGGQGLLENGGLGIRLDRVNVGEMKPKGTLATAAEQEVKEIREKAAEKVEIEHAIERVREIMDSLGVSADRAIRLFQTERGKISETVRTLGVSDEAELFRILGEFINRRSS